MPTQLTRQDHITGHRRGKKKEGRPRKSWLDNTNRKAKDRYTWARITAASCHGAPTITGPRSWIEIIYRAISTFLSSNSQVSDLSKNIIQVVHILHQSRFIWIHFLILSRNLFTSKYKWIYYVTIECIFRANIIVLCIEYVSENNATFVRMWISCRYLSVRIQYLLMSPSPLFFHLILVLFTYRHFEWDVTFNLYITENIILSFTIVKNHS